MNICHTRQTPSVKKCKKITWWQSFIIVRDSFFSSIKHFLQMYTMAVVQRVQYVHIQCHRRHWKISTLSSRRYAKEHVQITVIISLVPHVIRKRLDWSASYHAGKNESSNAIKWHTLWNDISEATIQQLFKNNEINKQMDAMATIKWND